MKINRIVLETSAANDLKKKDQVKGEMDFQKLLKVAHAKIDDVREEILSTPLDDPVRVLSNSFPTLSSFDTSAELSDLSQIRSQGIQTTETTLEILEQYQREMADPAIPLKRVDRLIPSLSQGILRLSALSGKLPPSDPLQRILTEVGILSAVEVEKFRRGEYL